MTMCEHCNKKPTLRASKPQICWGCAKSFGLCIYCGTADEVIDGVCEGCDPAKRSGMRGSSPFTSTGGCGGGSSVGGHGPARRWEAYAYSIDITDRR